MLALAGTKPVVGVAGYSSLRRRQSPPCQGRGLKSICSKLALVLRQKAEYVASQLLSRRATAAIEEAMCFPRIDLV